MTEATRYLKVEDSDVLGLNRLSSSEAMSRMARSLPASSEDAEHLHDVLADFDHMMSSRRWAAADSVASKTANFTLEPHAEPVSATVVRLNVESDWQDPFLALLDETCGGTDRGAVGSHETRQISIVMFDDTVITLDFNSELEYWSMVRAMRLATKGEPVMSTITCSMSNSAPTASSSEMVAAAGMISPLIYSFLS